MAEKKTQKSGWGERIGRAVPLTVIVGAFLWAAISIFSRQQVEYPADAIVIRMGHWQLEPQMPETLAQLAEEFENDPVTKALLKEKYGNRPVKIKQIKVGDPTYAQWITCQMMGEMAPDICEVGLAVLPDSLWLQFETRYFEPLTDLAIAPNPYNKVTEGDREELQERIRGVYNKDQKPVPDYLRLTKEQADKELASMEEFARLPLSQTYLDGMRAGYREQLQTFTKVPLSRFTARVFYNKSLYKKLTGKDQPSPDYRVFLADCKTIATQKLPDGMPYSAIAASGSFHIWMWNSGMFDPMTYSAIAMADFNRDGIVGSDETYTAIRSGRLSFNSPGIRAKFQMTGEIMPFFQPGFTGVSRDEAVMKFSKQQAVFISTGTWDVSSLVENTNGEFEVGIMPFPRPSPDDPEYGRLMVGPYLDKADQGFSFGVTRFSKYPDVAKAFLLFMASRRENQKLNHAINWLPALRGVPLPEMLSKFTSNPRGMTTGQDFLSLGGDSVTLYMQRYSQFQNDYNVDGFIDSVEAGYKEKGLKDWENQQRDWRQAVLNSERMLAVIRGTALLEGAKEDDPLWVRYRAFTANRQVMPEIIRETQVRTVRDKPLRPVGPYEFLPGAIENIRKNAASRPAGVEK